MRVLAILTILAGVAGAVPPAVIPWRDAGAHVGEIITVEGQVVTAETSGDTCVLEFAPGDPLAFRAVLLLPILSRGPRRPERIYRGRQVQATGRVQRFQGRPEMLLRSTDQIQVTGDADSDAPVTEPEADVRPAERAPPAARSPEPAPPPASPAAPETHPVSPGPPEAPPVSRATPDAPAATRAVAEPPAAAAPAPAPTAEPPPARGLVEAVEQTVASVSPCERAHARWRDAAAVASARTAALGRCLEAGTYDCRLERRSLAPALAALGVTEDEVSDACR